MKLNVLIWLAIALVLSGCASFKKSSIAFNTNSKGSLSIWNADMSAAVAYPDGQMCMQRALAIKTKDASVTTKVSEAIVALSNTATQLSKEGKSGELASIVGTLKETATLLTTSTERTAFLDMGLFYLCQISANGSLTDTQTAELARVISISAASLDQPSIGALLQAALGVKIIDGNNAYVPFSAPVKRGDKDGVDATKKPN